MSYPMVNQQSHMRQVILCLAPVTSMTVDCSMSSFCLSKTSYHLPSSILLRSCFTMTTWKAAAPPLSLQTLISRTRHSRIFLEQRIISFLDITTNGMTCRVCCSSHRQSDYNNKRKCGARLGKDSFKASCKCGWDCIRRFRNWKCGRLSVLSCAHSHSNISL